MTKALLRKRLIFQLMLTKNAAGTTHLNTPVQEQNETEKLQAQLQEQKDKYLRLYAEFDNYRRRTSKERIELMQTAGKDVIVSLLDVLDDCDRAEKTNANNRRPCTNKTRRTIGI